MKKNLVPIMLCAISLSLLTNLNAYDAHATQDTEQSQPETKTTNLLGYFYKDKEFKELSFMSENAGEALTCNTEDITEFLNIETDTFQSFQWRGRIKLKESAEFMLKLIDDKQAVIKVNGTVLSTHGENKQAMKFEENQFYDLSIEYVADQPLSIKELEKKQLRLYKITDKKEQMLSNEELFPIDFSQTGNTNYATTCTSLGSADTDCDSINDEFETKGYTKIGSNIVRWEDKYAPNYPKYVSNPNDARTAGDPYTDMEKVLGYYDQSNKKETKNPLIAACPVVNVSLENLIISSNETFSNSSSLQSSNSFSNTTSNGTSAKLKVGFVDGGLDFSAHISQTYEQANTTSVDARVGEGNSSEVSASERGFLRANMHYNNIGTASVYDLKPTLSFGLGNQTINTITAQKNNQALVIKPEASYPQQGKNGINIWTSDMFNARPISLNQEQYNAIIRGTLPVSLKVNQFDGTFVKRNASGSISEKGQWSYYLPKVKAKTAAIILDDSASHTENSFIAGITQKHVAARNYADPEDLTPSLSLKEALKLAYPDEVTEKNGLLYINDTHLNESAIQSFVDENTANLMKKQLQDETGPFKDVKSLFDAKLEPGMNITLKTSLIYIGWENDSDTALEPKFEPRDLKIVMKGDGNTGNLALLTKNTSKFGFFEKDVKKLSKDTAYTFSFYVSDMKAGKLNEDCSIVLKSSKNELKKTSITITEQESKLRKNGYKRYDIDFFNEEGKELKEVEFFSKSYIRIDDIAISERASSKEELEAVFERKRKEKEALRKETIRQLPVIFSKPIFQYGGSSNHNLNSLTFENVQKKLESIKIKRIFAMITSSDGFFNHDSPVYNFDSNGNLKVNLLDYHAGKGIDTEKPYTIVLLATLDDGKAYPIYSKTS